MPTARDRPPEEAAEDTSFARGLRILLTVADRGEIRADELSALLETPLSTVYRYLRTLAEFGFVDRHGRGYRLGPRLLIGGGPTVSSEHLIRLADPVLRSLVEETGETAVICRRVGLAAVCLLEIQSAHPLRVALEPGTASPLYAGALSRVLLAYAPAELVEEVVGAGIVPLTPATPDEARLRSSLAEIEAAGIGRSEGELISGTVTLAVPVFQDDGIVAAIGVIGPESRCGAAWRARAAQVLSTSGESLIASIATSRPTTGPTLSDEGRG
ncbi:MAG: IclR family transcriptional regulator [Chloroflexota bacterium]